MTDRDHNRIAAVNAALDKACAFFGTQQALADALGIRSPSISEWRTSGNVPPRRCKAMERLTGGAVTRSMFDPDLFGVVVVKTVAASEAAVSIRGKVA